MIRIGGIVKTMWTLEQAIEDTERAYKESRNGLQYALKRGETKFAERCKKDAEEFGQLAEWLRELQERRKESKTIKCLDCVHALTCNRRIDFGNGLFFTISSCSMAERRTDDNSRINLS